MQVLLVGSIGLHAHAQVKALLYERRTEAKGPRRVQVQRQTEEENAAAEAEQLHLQEEEWNMAELERIQEQQVSHPILLLSIAAACMV